jgi:hypothetical protein
MRQRSNKQGNLRERIAHLAARIMAEDGIDDFGYAKRKAARQAGALDARAMPDNEEIERALADYRQLYRPEEHASNLGLLRRQALDLMRRLGRFNPHLTGPVLSGVAGKHSRIELHLFADSPKDFELFLLNQGVRYRAGQLRLFHNDAEKVVPSYSFEHEEVEAQVLVLDRADLRHPLKSSPAGKPIERASTASVEALLRSD